MAGLIYLASPFSHNNPAMRQHRFLEARRFTIKALRDGIALFSPIVYGMDMEKEIGTNFEPWVNLNDTIIHQSSEVWVLCLDGWKDSRGIKYELELALNLLKPIHFYTSYGVRVNASD